MGDGTTTDRLTPVDVAGLAGGVQAVVAGGYHACALTAAGGVKCWGDNDFGQLGDGATTSSSVLVDVTGLAGGVQALTTSYDHTCALMTTTARVKCFGSDSYGQLGVGTLVQRLTPVDVVDAPTPSLKLNNGNGQPGSIFTLTGWNFPPNSQGTLTVNGQALTTTLAVNATGGFIVFLDTAASEDGVYLVNVSVNPSATTGFVMQASAPLRAIEGGGVVHAVPAGLGGPVNSVYLPVMHR